MPFAAQSISLLLTAIETGVRRSSTAPKLRFTAGTAPPAFPMPPELTLPSLVGLLPPKQIAA